eukprot:3677360-Prymnesium_polylepis.1
MEPGGSEWRHHARVMLSSKPWFAFVMASISVSTVFVALESPDPRHPSELNDASDIGQCVCAFIFAIEMGLKCYAF